VRGLLLIGVTSSKRSSRTAQGRVRPGYRIRASKATGTQVGEPCVHAFELFLCCLVAAEPSRLDVARRFRELLLILRGPSFDNRKQGLQSDVHGSIISR
jgi:hypothetical protein